MNMSTETVTRSLEELEAVISKGLKTFVEVGNALREIRERTLYGKRGFGTFDEYLQTRWTMSRPRAYQLIEAAGVVGNLSKILDKLPNEAQVHELARLSPDRQREVAATIDFQHATAKQIRERVRKELQTVKAKTAQKGKPAHQPKSVPSDMVAKIERGLVQAAALPQPITNEQLFECLGTKSNSMKKMPWNRDRALIMVPWSHLHVLGNGKVRVTIDHELKRVCDGKRPSRSGEMPNGFCQRLLAELIRRRKEINDKNRNGRWLPENVSKLELAMILDWVQCELEEFNVGQSVDRREEAAKIPQLIG